MKLSRRERKERVRRAIAARSKTRRISTVKAGKPPRERKELTAEERAQAEVFFTALGNAFVKAIGAFVDSLTDTGQALRMMDDHYRKTVEALGMPVEWPDSLPDEREGGDVDEISTNA